MPWDTPLDKRPRARPSSALSRSSVEARMYLSKRPTAAVGKYQWIDPKSHSLVPASSISLWSGDAGGQAASLLRARRNIEAEASSISQLRADSERCRTSFDSTTKTESRPTTPAVASTGLSRPPSASGLPSSTTAIPSEIPNSDLLDRLSELQVSTESLKGQGFSIRNFVEALLKNDPLHSSDPAIDATSGGEDDDIHQLSVAAGSRLTVPEHQVSRGLVEVQKQRSGFESTPFTPLDVEYYDDNVADVPSDLNAAVSSPSPVSQTVTRTVGDYLNSVLESDGNPSTAGPVPQSQEPQSQSQSQSNVNSPQQPSTDSKTGNGLRETSHVDDGPGLNKGRALFQQWCEKAPAECSGFKSRLVWVRAVWHQLENSTKSLTGPNVYRLLTSVCLLLSSFDALVPPGEAKVLIFTLLDEVLKGLFTSWPISEETLGGSSHSETAGSSSGTTEVPSSKTKSADVPLPTPYTSPSTSNPIPFSMAIAKPSTANWLQLGRVRLCAEAWKVEGLRRERTLAECRSALKESEDTLRIRTTLLHEQLNKSKRSMKKLVFSAWKNCVFQAMAKKQSILRIVGRLSNLRDEALKRTSVMALQVNATKQRCNRAEIGIGDQVRDWQKKEMNLLFEISNLKNQLGAVQSDSKLRFEQLQDAHAQAMQKMLCDTEELRNRAGSDADRIALLTSERDEARRQAAAWKAVANATLSELKPHDRLSATDELLFSVLQNPDGSQGEKRVQVSPYGDIREVIRLSSAPQRILLLFCNAMLRRYRPQHPGVKNFGSDLADGEAYLSALIHLFPSKINQRAFALPTGPPRAQEVCRVLSEVGLDGILAPVDILLGTVLRNLSLVTSLFRIFSASTREKFLLTDIDRCFPGGEAAAPPTVEVNELVASVPIRVEHETPQAAMAECLSTALQNRGWAFLADFVQRDTLERLQNVRHDGEILDERRKKEMEWFLALDQVKCEEKLLSNIVNPFNAPNEFDKVSSVVQSFGFDLLAVYFAYTAAGEGCSRMTQSGLYDLYEDLKLAPSNHAIEEAYKFATADAANPNGLIFAPTAVGASSRKMTASMANMPVSPSVFLHVLLHLAHFKVIMGGKRKAPQSLPDSSVSGPASLDATRTNINMGGEPGSASVEFQPHNKALKQFFEEELLPKAKFSLITSFHMQARNPLVSRVFKRYDRQLQKVFKRYASKFLDGEPIEGQNKKDGPDRGKTITVDAIMMTLEDCQRFARDCRLVDVRFPSPDLQTLFYQLQLDEAKVHQNCIRFPTEREPLKPLGFGFADWIEFLSGIAASRNATPHIPLHWKVEFMFRDTLGPRLKELVG